MKVKDEQRVLCNADRIADIKPGYNMTEYRNGLRVPDEFMREAVAVLGDSERGLVMYSMDVSSPDSLINRDGRGNNKHDNLDITTMFYSSFYTVNITIGSSLFDDEYIGSVADKDVKDHTCKSGTNSRDSYAEYCALNNIEFVARTGSV